MTLYRRVKDYCNRRRAHYHLERIALPSDEPTKEELRDNHYDGDWALGIEAYLPKDLTDKLRDRK